MSETEERLKNLIATGTPMTNKELGGGVSNFVAWCIGIGIALITGLLIFAMK